MRMTWSKGCLLLAALAVWMLPAALLSPDAGAFATAILLDEDHDEDEHDGDLATLSDDDADKDEHHDGALAVLKDGDEEEGDKDCDKHKKDSQLRADPEEDEGDAEELVEEEEEPEEEPPPE